MTASDCKEYIEKETAITKLRDVYEYEYPTASGDFDDYAIRIVPNVLHNLEPADVKPVVKGEWKWNDDNGYYYCSECGAASPRKDQDSEYIDCPHFCHNCGAEMEV